jgi:hypothetical protein
MRTPTSHVVSEWTDNQGRRIVKVALAKGRGFVELTREDFDRLVSVDLGPPWNANANSTRKGGHAYARRDDAAGNNTVVARLIAGASARESVTYVDGNRFNLRPENLKIANGGRAKRDAAITVATALRDKTWLADAIASVEAAE